MTHVTDVLAASDALAGTIQRQPHGWRTYVTVQDMAPNTPKYSWANAGAVDHCGLSVNTVYTRAGLVMGRDFGDNAWTPSGYEWMRARGRLVTLDDVRAGDSVYIRWGNYGYNVHHIELAVGPRNADGTIPTRGWNVNTTGQGLRFNRPPSVIVGIGRPFGIDYAPQPTPQDPDVSTHVTVTTAVLASLQQQEDTMPLILDLIDDSGAVVGHRGYLPGLGWHTPVDGSLTEDNGWTRARISQREFDRAGLVALQNSATMTEAVAKQVKAIMEAS